MRCGADSEDESLYSNKVARFKIQIAEKALLLPLLLVCNLSCPLSTKLSGKREAISCGSSSFKASRLGGPIGRAPGVCSGSLGSIPILAMILRLQHRCSAPAMA